MIFLFFTSSLGPLEPELAPFKDLEEIGDIWKISLKVAQAPTDFSLISHWFPTDFWYPTDFLNIANFF